MSDFMGEKMLRDSPSERAEETYIDGARSDDRRPSAGSPRSTVIGLIFIAIVVTFVVFGMPWLLSR